jgi:hypothetical protein
MIYPAPGYSAAIANHIKEAGGTFEEIVNL